MVKYEARFTIKELRLKNIHKLYLVNLKSCN